MNSVDKKREKTVGQITSELKKKEDNYSVNAFQFGKEWLKKGKYAQKLEETVEGCKKTYDGDFYVLMMLKKERMSHRTLRTYFVGRKSCPTPMYDQSVFRYIRKDEKLEHLWTVPSTETCDAMLENRAFVPPEEWALLRHIIKFKDGTLLHKAMTLNGEIND